MARTGVYSQAIARLGRVLVVAATIMVVPVWTTAQAKAIKKDSKQADCWERKGKLAFGPGARIGPCMGAPYFECPNGAQTAIDYWDHKCGPTPEDCGCKIVAECSKPEHIKCYQGYSANKEALACFTNPDYSNYDATKCYESLIKAK